MEKIFSEQIADTFKLTDKETAAIMKNSVSLIFEKYSSIQIEPENNILYGFKSEF